MDLDFSCDSVAFSDVAAPAYVSELESFSDFEFSDASSVEFAGIGTRDYIEERPEERDGAEQQGIRGTSTQKDVDRERIPSALQDLNAGSVMECLAARKDLIPQGKLSDSALDQSSLGILQLDSFQDTSDEVLKLSSAEAESPVMIRAPVGDETPRAQNGHVSVASNNFEEIPPSYNDSQAVGSAEPTRKTMGSRRKGKRPDTGRVPDDFFNATAVDIESGNDVHHTNGEDSLGFSIGQDPDLDFILPGRSGSGDGGEFIDRMSLSSGMSFIQSQTLPTESIFSLSSASRGLGSGMDSRPGSANGGDAITVDEQVNPVPPDDHNEEENSGLARRPGLEGANSDTEDAALPWPMLLSVDQRQAVAGVRELRQSAEGGVVVPDVPGDGGGGGDGSSGHSSDDNGGPSGVAYVSSSSSTAPSASVPLPPNAIDALLRLGLAVGERETGHAPDVSGLPGDRGHPVGGAVVGDWSGAVAASPLPDNRFSDQSSRASFMNTGQFDFQVASTPMVVAERDTGDDVSVASESSGLHSCYLLAAGSSNGSVAATPHAALTQESSFHMSQMLLGNQTDEDADQTLTEVPSLNFDVEDSATPMSLKQQTLVANKRDPSAGCDRHVTEHHTAFQPDTSDVCLKLTKSVVLPSDKSGLEGDSQLWKSTPREGEEASRATPGIIFRGDLHPSPVTGHQDSDQASHSTNPTPSSNNSVIEVAKEGSTLTANDAWKDNVSGGVAKVQEYLSKLSVVPFERTLTPGGPSDETASRWSSYPFTPSPVVRSRGGDEYTQKFAQGPNPFDSEDEGLEWSGVTGEDVDFVPQQGNVAEILDADERSFKRDLLENPPVHSSFFQDHDWTIPDDSKLCVRPSLMAMFGIDEPKCKEDARISVGQFLAAGSEELGSLSCRDPERPRPHFGEDRMILTPSPQAPPKIFSDSIGGPREDDHGNFLEQTRPNESLKFSDLLPEKDLHGKTEEIRPVRQITDNNCETSSGQRVDIKESNARAWIPTRARLFEDQGKSQVDDHGKKEETSRDRRGSRDSSYSSSSSKSSTSSRRSVKSVIKRRDNGQSETRDTSDGHVDRQDRRPSDDPKKSPATRNQPRRTDSPKVVEAEARESKNVISSRDYESLESLSNLETATGHPRSQTDRVRPPADPSTDASTNTAAGLPSALINSDMSPQDLVGFIAKAIKVNPDELRWLMGATKSRVTEKSPEGSLSAPTASRSGNLDERGANPPQGVESAQRLQGSASDDASIFLAQPIASSSPTAPQSPERVLVSDRSMPDVMTGSTCAGLQSEEKVAERHDPPANSNLPSTPPRVPFCHAHIVPEFGETYTVRKVRHFVNPKTTTVDPLKRRTSEIEDRLDKSLPPVKASNSLPLSPTRVASGEEKMSTSRANVPAPYFPPVKQTVPSDSFDSAVGNLSSHRTFEESKSKSGVSLSDTANSEPGKDFLYSTSGGETSGARKKPSSQHGPPSNRAHTPVV